MPGVPTLTSSPSTWSSTRSKPSSEPTSALTRPTRIWSPAETRYCFPPLTTTAVADCLLSGTNVDCTTGPLRPSGSHETGVEAHRPALAEQVAIRRLSLPVEQQPPAQHHRLDRPHRREVGDQGRPAVGDHRKLDPPNRA